MVARGQTRRPARKRTIPALVAWSSVAAATAAAATALLSARARSSLGWSGAPRGLVTLAVYLVLWIGFWTWHFAKYRLTGFQDKN